MGAILNALEVFLGGQNFVADDRLKEHRSLSADRDRVHWVEVRLLMIAAWVSGA